MEKYTLAGDKMNTKQVYKICFFGPSGAGKSTCATILKQILEKEGAVVKIVNVAQPLHQIQAYAYKKFHLKNTGQDGTLLQFLAAHFEARLGLSFEKRVLNLISKFDGKKLVIINSDCRNNSYKYLKNVGFIFIRVMTDASIISQRLNQRGDVSKTDNSKAVEHIDWIKAHTIVDNNGSMEKLREKITHLIHL